MDDVLGCDVDDSRLMINEMQIVLGNYVVLTCGIVRIETERIVSVD